MDEYCVVYYVDVEVREFVETRKFGFKIRQTK